MPKVRPIDNYRASRVNAAVTQSEQVTVHTLDVVAGMVSSWLARAKEQNVKAELAAKTWGLQGCLQTTAAQRCRVRPGFLLRHFRSQD